jgi:ribose transport system ATP-binding protein
MNGAANVDVPAVRMKGVSKSFGGVQALTDVHLEVKYGEIHALLGGNGAGKSTVLKILRGVHAPTSGTVEVNGRALTAHTPQESKEAGIAMIFQEMSLVPTLTVAENIFLNNEFTGSFGLIDDKEARRQARALFKSLDVDIDPDALAGDLGAGQRQLTEIVKAISKKARILILDEPSTALSAHDVERLFTFLRKLKSEGVAIIYVSHRMDEIMRIADRATIFRDGRHVITAPLSELNLTSIIQHIVGKSSKGLDGIERMSHRRSDVLLELEDVSGQNKPKKLSFKLHAGEVLGIAGLLGSGRSSIARLLFGIDPIVHGTVKLRGVATKLTNPEYAIAKGIALIPEDRLRQGAIIAHSVSDNLALAVLPRISRAGWISAVHQKTLATDKIKQLMIKTNGPDAPVQTLSGGNQQKVVLGKWLASNPDIIILDEPTAGIDIGSKSEIIQLIRSLAAEGKGILVISSELNELLAACDRILVMADGHMVREIDRGALDPEQGPTALDAMQFAEHRLQEALQEVVHHV